MMQHPELAPSTSALPEPYLVDFPDPLVSANLYAAGKLDQLLLCAIQDFRQRLARHDPDQRSYFWFLRYRRCGEHLKLRIHAPAELEPIIRRELLASAEAFFADLPKASEAGEAAARSAHLDVPPLDAEDRGTDLHPDLSLLFTEYQRSHISLGGQPLLGDDAYVANLTRFLAIGSERVLRELKLDAEGEVPHRLRQNGLIKILIGALGELELSEQQRTNYLRHHRDWLLRFSLIKTLDRAEKARELLQKFDRQIERMGSGTGPIERNLSRYWGQGAENEASYTPLRSLVSYLESFRHDENYQLDPFTCEPAFTGIFKALHGVANQLGLNMIDEAFTHQLLLSLRDPEQAALAVQLMPD